MKTIAALILFVVVISVAVIGSASGGYVGSPLIPPVYGAQYGYSPVPVVKSLSSVAVAHAPLATSYANTYKFSHPVIKPAVYKHYAPYYYSPLYSYGHGYDYDYPLYSGYSPYYLHK